MTARAKKTTDVATNDAPPPLDFQDGDRLTNPTGDVVVRICGRWHVEQTGVPMVNVTDADLSAAVAADSLTFAPAEPDPSAR